MEQIAEALVKDADKHAAEWRKKVEELLLKAAEQESATGNQTLYLSPMAVRHLALDEYAAVVSRYLLPVVLSKDPWKYYERLEGICRDGNIVGLGRFRLLNSPGSAIVYMHEHIAHLFPLRDETVEASERMVSCKYFLPLVYRYLEESDFPPPCIFEAERQWSALIKADIPIDRFAYREQSEKWREVQRGLLDLPHPVGESGGPAIQLTGVTAALLELNTQRDNVPFPIEATTEFLPESVERVRAQLTPHGKLEVRQFGVNHPSGSWYISVAQFLLDERIVLMLYDTTRYIAHGVTTDNRLSPFVVMAQLCYSAWLLERRGIDRAKWVYSILRRYRDACATRGDRGQKYRVPRVPENWEVYYALRSPAQIALPVGAGVEAEAEAEAASVSKRILGIGA